LNLDHPLVSDFAQAVDLACGRMVRQGLTKEAMVHLTSELVAMFSNDSFARPPLVSHSRELSEVLVAILCHLRGEQPLDVARLEASFVKLHANAAVAITS